MSYSRSILGGSTLGGANSLDDLIRARATPQMLMAQKIMELNKEEPKVNATMGSSLANALNQGARGLLSGYLYNQGIQSEKDQQEKWKQEARDFFGDTGPSGTPAPTEPTPAPAPTVRPWSGGTTPTPGNASGGTRVSLGSGGPAPKPELVQVSSPSGVKVTVAREAAPAFTSFLAELEGSGYKLDPGQTSGYNQRKIAGTDTWSQHAHGNAVDINWRANPRGANGPSDLPPNIGDIAAKYGLTWGGNWKGNTRDPMHFEYTGGSRHAEADPGVVDALMRGVDQPKPRGVQLAENLVPGVVSDAPTPILPDMGDAQGTAAPRIAVNAAPLPGPAAAAPVMPSPPAASVPGPEFAVPPVPPMATAAAPPLAPLSAPDAAVVPPPQAASVSAPTPAVVPAPDAAVVPPPTPAVVPPPDAAIVPPPDAAVVPPAPDPTPLIPNPQAGLDPGALQNFNGPGAPPPTPAVVPAPDAAVVPPPTPAVVPPPAPATLPPTGGASRPDLPIPVPPIPPNAAQPNSAARPGSDNASDALNAASLAAAQRGETYVPGGAAPAGGPVDLFQQAGIPSPYTQPAVAGAAPGPWGGDQALAAADLGTGASQFAGGPLDLVTPTSDTTTDTSAAGGPTKGQAMGERLAPGAGKDLSAPNGAQLGARLLSPERIDWLYNRAQLAASSSNPLIRAQAPVLAAQAQRAEAARDRWDRQQETLDLRRETNAQRAQDRADTRADRQQTHQDTLANQQQQRDEARQKIELERRRVELEEKKAAAEKGTYGGTGLQQQNYSVLDRLHESIANGTASEADKRIYSRAYNDLQKGAPVAVQDPNDKSKVIMVPGQPTDLSGYAPPPYKDTTTAPSKPATEAERVAAGFTNRMEMADADMRRVGEPSSWDVAMQRGGVLGNYLSSDKGQQYQQAAAAWIRAKLRKESGAAIGVQEMQQEFETYFPQPGDSPAKIEQKRRYRELETRNMRMDAGNAYQPYTPPADTGTGPVRLPAGDEGKRQYDALPRGAQYVAPDGSIRTKQ